MLKEAHGFSRREYHKMGISPDFELRPLEELRESMRQHGIRAEDNEFSRAIIEERENIGG